MFSVKVITDFSAAHALRGYQGDCARVHGHNWTVETTLAVEVLDEIGISVDFKVIKEQTKSIINTLDHQFINEIKPFDMINPTAENLSKYFYQTLKKQLKSLYGSRVVLAKVNIWETPRACVSYYEH